MKGRPELFSEDMTLKKYFHNVKKFIFKVKKKKRKDNKRHISAELE